MHSYTCSLHFHFQSFHHFCKCQQDAISIRSNNVFKSLSNSSWTEPYVPHFIHLSWTRHVHISTQTHFLYLNFQVNTDAGIVFHLTSIISIDLLPPSVINCLSEERQFINNKKKIADPKQLRQCLTVVIYIRWDRESNLTNSGEDCHRLGMLRGLIRLLSQSK